jgi:hypothetical protein
MVIFYSYVTNYQRISQKTTGVFPFSQCFIRRRRWVESIQNGLGPSGALLALVANKAQGQRRDEKEILCWITLWL